MQRNYETNLLLAQQVLTQIKLSVLSSNDIIPAVDLPNIYTDEMERYISAFGQKAVGKQVDYLKELEKVRTASQKLLEREQGRWKSPVSTSTVATTLCGVGECQETSNRAALELVGVGCKSLVNLVSIVGKSNPKHGGSEPYLHVFVIIGDCTPLIEGESSINAFARLSDECVLLDPFLNITGRANQLTTLLKDYIRVFGMSAVSESYCEIDPATVNYAERMQDAAAFAEEIKAEMAANRTNKVDFTNDGDLASFMFFTATNPLANCLKQLCLACKNVTGGQDVYAAIVRTQYSQALRKACVIGSVEIVRLLMANRDLLDNFDLNEASPSNGRTALDWLELAVLDAGVKREIKSLLVPAPAPGAVSPAQK